MTRAESRKRHGCITVVHRNDCGFSLPELALALAIMGMLAMVAMKLLPGLTGMFHEQAREDILNRMDRLLTGFAISHGRLPCPDVNGDGREDCSAPGQPVQAVGRLPYVTLGMAAPVVNSHGVPLRYGVFRQPDAQISMDADLAAAQSRYKPLLPLGVNMASPVDIGLCAALRNAAKLPVGSVSAALRVGGDVAAYAIADSGGLDADGANGLWDGVNGLPGTQFESPGKMQAANYDDRVLATGFAELAGRIGCAEVLARVNGLARAVYAAEDINQLAMLHSKSRAFGVRVQQLGVGFAAVQRDLAIANLAIATATTVSALAISIQTGGLGATDVAAAVYAESQAAVKLASAITALQNANNALNAANTTSANANARQQNVAGWFNARMNMLQRALSQGLLP